MDFSTQCSTAQATFSPRSFHRSSRPSTPSTPRIWELMRRGSGASKRCLRRLTHGNELLVLRDRRAARHAVGTTPRLNALRMVFVPAATDSDDPGEGRVFLLLPQADGTELIVRNVGIHHRFDAGLRIEPEPFVEPVPANLDDALVLELVYRRCV